MTDAFLPEDPGRVQPSRTLGAPRIGADSGSADGTGGGSASGSAGRTVAPASLLAPGRAGLPAAVPLFY